MRPTKRAPLQAAIDAAFPRRCVEALERDISASTTPPAVDSKVKTFVSICRAWQVAPWPVSMESILAFGALLKKGGHKSSQGFFQAVFIYQRRHLQTEVAGLCDQECCERLCSQHLSRAWTFDLEGFLRCGVLDKETCYSYDVESFTMNSAVHGRDVLVLAGWYMMRELPVADGRTSTLKFRRSIFSLQCRHGWLIDH